MRHAPIAFVLLALACSGTEPPDPPPPGSGALIVGAGEEDGSAGFIAVDDGVDLVLQPGAQGGFHVYVNLRFTEASLDKFGAEEKPLIRRFARRTDAGTLVSRSTHTTTLMPAPDAEGMYDTENSIPVFLCPSPIGVQVAEERLILEVEAAADEDDPEPIIDTLEFVPRCPEGDQEEFCRRICFG
ncbi:MAG: hypothetical protein RMA76_15480 [Deltaproteobacteria bacterium]|jgi:hypothetical protein